MAINLNCPGCKQHYSIPDQHAGKRFKCKKCGRPIAVPKPQAADDEFDELDDDDFLAGLNEASRQSTRSEALPPPAALPSAAKKPAGAKKKKKSSDSSESSVGKILGIVVAVFFGLGGLGIVGKVVANLGPGYSKDVSGWKTVETGFPNVTVKMPGTPKSQSTWGSRTVGSAKGYETRTTGFLVTQVDRPPGLPIDLTEQQAASLRDVTIAGSRSSPNTVSIDADGPINVVNGHWTFRSKGVAQNKGKQFQFSAYYVLMPDGLVVLLYMSKSSIEESDAKRFFDTLQSPAGNVAASSASQSSTGIASTNPVAPASPSSAAHSAESHSAEPSPASPDAAAMTDSIAAVENANPNGQSGVVITPEGFPGGTLPEGMTPGDFPSEFNVPGGPPSSIPGMGGFNPLDLLPPPPEARPESALSYQEFRKTFQTQLTQVGPAPQPFMDSPLEPGVTKVEFKSGNLSLVGYEWKGDATPSDKRPAILFLHGGFACDPNEILAIKPFLDAGFVGFAPTYRGENGNAGEFTLFCNEVIDAANAATWLASRRYVDKDHIYCIGHSAGGGVAALLSLLDNVPIQSTASVGGLYGPDAFQPDSGLPVPFAATPDEIRARTLFGNTSDMRRAHYGYVGLLDLAMVPAVGQIKADVAVNGGRQPLLHAEYVGGDHFSSFEPAMSRYLKICMTDAGLDPGTSTPSDDAGQPAETDSSPFQRRGKSKQN